jgi:hypothetical protein
MDLCVASNLTEYNNTRLENESQVDMYGKSNSEHIKNSFKIKNILKKQSIINEEEITLNNLIRSANEQLNSLINGPTYKRDYPTLVRVYIVFLKVGEIDNVKERFQADAYIEASWEDNSIDPKHQNSSFDPKCYWNPDLYIENSLGNLNQTIKYKTEKTANGIRVVEMRTIKGSFWEKLELGEFPLGLYLFVFNVFSLISFVKLFERNLDIQDLSITITSAKPEHEVIIDLNRERECVINTDEFRMQQEWILYPHINTQNRFVKDIVKNFTKPAFTFSSKIARKPGYYIYNCYMLLFTITVLGFVPFSFNYYSAHFRIQTTCLLILSSVNFRLIVTKSLPTVSYLTTLDIYAIMALLFLILLSCWHAIIGSWLIAKYIDDTIEKIIDNFALYSTMTIYVLFHLAYVTYFIYKYLRYGNCFYFTIYLYVT